MTKRKVDNVEMAGEEMLCQPQLKQATAPGSALIFFSPFPLTIGSHPIPFKARTPFPEHQVFISLDPIGECKIKDYSLKSLNENPKS